MSITKLRKYKFIYAVWRKFSFLRWKNINGASSKWFFVDLRLRTIVAKAWFTRRHNHNLNHNKSRYTRLISVSQSVIVIRNENIFISYDFVMLKRLKDQSLDVHSELLFCADTITFIYPSLHFLFQLTLLSAVSVFLQCPKKTAGEVMQSSTVMNSSHWAMIRASKLSTTVIIL